METLPGKVPIRLALRTRRSETKAEALSGDPDIKTDSLAEVTEILLEGVCPCHLLLSVRIRLNVTAIGHM